MCQPDYYDIETNQPKSSFLDKIRECHKPHFVWIKTSRQWMVFSGRTKGLSVGVDSRHKLHTTEGFTLLSGAVRWFEEMKKVANS